MGRAPLQAAQGNTFHFHIVLCEPCRSNVYFFHKVYTKAGKDKAGARFLAHDDGVGHRQDERGPINTKSNWPFIAVIKAFS